MATNKQKREAERRRLQRQTARRREQAARRKKLNLIISIVGVIVVVAGVMALLIGTSGDDDKNDAAASPTPSTPAPSSSVSTTTKPGSCTFPKSAQPASRAVKLPATTQPIKGTVNVSVQTTRGTMVFALDRAAAPCTVGSFLSLVKQKFYDKTPCPRVESTNLFILQCGDPTGLGTGGPGYTIPDEYKGTEKYTTGSLAMANTGQPNSGGSQFFIIYKDDPLPAKYTIFGKVTKGLDIVAKVAAGGNDGSNQAGGGKPKFPITLTKLSIAK